MFHPSETIRGGLQRDRHPTGAGIGRKTIDDWTAIADLGEREQRCGKARISGVTAPRGRAHSMIKFLLFCILLVVCWPLALAALIAYPIVWLLLIPFRLLGIAVGGVLELVSAIIFLPARVLRRV